MVAPSSTSPTAKASVRVMLLLSADEAKFVEGLAAAMAQPGVSFTKQDAIRSVLAKLRLQMEAEQLSPLLPGIAKTKAAAPKRSSK